MVEITLKGKKLELATSLRVAYAMKDISGAESLQEAIGSMSRLDLNGQLNLMYAAYKAGSGRDHAEFSKTDFEDAVLDEFGIFKITSVVNGLIDGILYSGMSPEEVAAKKKEVEETASKAGEVSSAEPTDSD